jgi:hypothetical protein
VIGYIGTPNPYRCRILVLYADLSVSAESRNWIGTQTGMYEVVDWSHLAQDRSVSPPAGMVINLGFINLGEWLIHLRKCELNEKDVSCRPLKAWLERAVLG